LLSLFAIVAGLAWAMMWGRTWWLPSAGLIALCLPSIGLAIKQVLASRKYSDFLPLFALYLTYGIARAKALLSIRNFV